MSKYYMTQRPPMPGAMPKIGLVDIQDLNPNDIIPEIGKGAYALLTYSQPLSGKDICDYELTPYGQQRSEVYKGYELTFLPQHQEWAVTSLENPQLGVIAYCNTREEVIEGIDDLMMP